MRAADKPIRRWVLAFVSVAAPALAEPEPDPAELPRIAPVEAGEALSTFEIRPGYKLELAAAEPMVVDPIAMAFDGSGKRMFVVEMRGYSERRDEKLGRVRLLYDDDGDGRFDRSTVFAEGLSWPTGVIAWKRGAFVIASPDILFFEDSDGDGAADRREVVFTGFGAGAKRLNVQALPNNLKWGGDGRIHGATAGNGGKVGRPGDKQTIDLRGLDFSFDPEKLDLRPENGGGQYGLCFDRAGRKFVCSNSNHIQMVMYPRRYQGLGLPPARVGIAADGPAAEVYRTSPDEPWRIVRTRWRVAGEVGGPVEGGGRVSGYFTAATGIGIYRGDAFIADAGSNLVHRKKLDYPEGGVQPVARRPADEKEVEFLTSTDNWFRPVQVLPGSDGALYIADMYREVIEHPWSLPASIKKHLDLNSGSDRGRIYRIVPDPGVLPEAESDLPLGRIVELEARGELTLLERVELAKLARHPSAQVRFQLALTLGVLEGGWRTGPLVQILAEGGGDPWIRAAALAALDASPGEVFAQLAAADPPASDGALLGAVRYVADEGSVADKAAAARFGENVRRDLRFRIYDLVRVYPRGFEGVEILKLVDDRRAGASPERLAAMRIAARGSKGKSSTDLLARLPSEPLEVQRTALWTLQDLGRDPLAGFGRPLLACWGNLDETLRPLALQLLLGREEVVPSLLRAVERGEIARRYIDSETARRLREHKVVQVRTLAREVFGAESPSGPTVTLDKLRPALALEGDAEKGRAHFLARCATCHRAPDGAGAVYGPELASFKGSGKETIFTNFIDPNREVPPGYSAQLVRLKDGREFHGYLLGQDKRSVRLKLVGGFDQEFPRAMVAELKDLGVSAMPAGLEHGMSPQDVADLLAFIEGS